MASMTKAERQAHEAQAKAEQQAREAQEYLTRLMTALERSMQDRVSHNFSLTIIDGAFHVLERTGERTYVFAPVWSKSNQWELECFEGELSYLEAEIQEEDRLRQVRKTALAKLTEEERKILLG